jgi:ATP-dependent Clp protease, protease subunit
MYKPPADFPDPEQQTLQTRTVLLFGEVTAALAERTAQQLLLLAAQSRMPIKLVVNAQGGAVSAGEALYDLIAGLGLPVKVIGAGAVSRAAALAFVAAPRGERFCLPHARFSLYQDLQATDYPSHDVVAAAEALGRQRRRLHELFARQTGQPLDVIARDMERPHWLSAEEAIAYGVVGRVVEKVGDV